MRSRPETRRLEAAAMLAALLSIATSSSTLARVAKAGGASAADRAAAVDDPRASAPGWAWLDSVQWVNHAPIRAADLRGHVVVVEFWTFECVNCMRTVPAMRKLAAEFAGGDVVILGLHSPEFERERDRANVAAAIQRLGLQFPVAQDNDFAAWRAFGNQYWPALYVLDRSGRVRARHVGELHLGTPGWDSFVATIRDVARSRT
jgi:thiol-disulfide isomerase/thioredoxin